MHFTITKLVRPAAMAGALALLAGAAVAQELPKTMIWTSYDVGSAGYAEASAIADALGQKFGTKVRILPSGSGIGRLQPLLMGKADYGYLATETFFISDGAYDFAAPQWGPKNLRAVLGRPASISMVTAKDANIRTVADAKGKRMALVAGNPSVNVKCEAILAFGGLTVKDVDPITFPTYSAAMSSMTKNQADFTCTTPTTSQLYELAESPRGIYWVPLPADNKKGWAALEKVLPIMKPFNEDIAAGLKKGESVPMAAYRYPVIATTADKSDDEVYAFIKALDETYDMYKDGTATMKRWKIQEAGEPPIDVPFHPGAIRYLKEKGVWTAEDDAWNNKRIKRLDALMAAWKEFAPAHKGDSKEDFEKAWMAKRQEVVAGLGD
ncbi:TAXI family TRAP transporter solute-binding subunit [Acidimangrovimonas sediminis]|uniref:TAXI family TRAP transporter solute-binding subunit n=1 Tax=Acidimangrovimonas sediminis TaxID=2056283 RepID=UPI000C8011CA|nr:TAXI family TRAP transporter solute-binding subunit [Acidimangrovimonas sediminis]